MQCFASLGLGKNKIFGKKVKLSLVVDGMNAAQLDHQYNGNEGKDQKNNKYSLKTEISDSTYQLAQNASASFVFVDK